MATKSSDSTAYTAMPAFDMDMESQQNQIAYQPTSANSSGNLGQGMGIAMFVLLVVGSIFSLVFPPLSLICNVATIVIASILTCGCCCAEDYDLAPNKKKFATATLVSLCLIFIVQIGGLISVFAAVASSVPSDAGDGGQWSDQDEAASKATTGAITGIIVIGALSIVLKIAAIIFSALFTWGL